MPKYIKGTTKIELEKLFSDFKDNFREEITYPRDCLDKFAYKDAVIIDRFISKYGDRRYLTYKYNGLDVKVDALAPFSQFDLELKAYLDKNGNLLEIKDVLSFFQSIKVKRTFCEKKYSVKESKKSVFSEKKTETLELFGKLYSIEEVHRIITKEWKFNISFDELKRFYNTNLAKIDQMRDEYEKSMLNDLSLTKKRARLDKLSHIFYVWWNKFVGDPKLTYSQEMRALLNAIKEEVEGHIIKVDINGRINVDMTIEANKTYSEVFKKIPLNMFIVGMVAAKKGIDPMSLMAKLGNSYYSKFTGYSEPNRGSDDNVIDFKNLVYNWDEIRIKSEAESFTEVKVLESKPVEPEIIQKKESLLDVLKKRIENNNQESKI